MQKGFGVIRTESKKANPLLRIHALQKSHASKITMRPDS